MKHKGRSICFTDLSETTPEQAIAVLEQSHQYMSTLPPASAYVLVSIKGIKFNTAVIDKVKEITKANRPYVRATAVYGVEGLTKLLITVVATFSGRELKPFDSEAAAKEWLYKRSMAREDLLAS